MWERLLVRNDLVCRVRHDRAKYGIVQKVGGCEDSDDSSDSDSEIFSDEVDEGYVLVKWVQTEKFEIVPDNSVELLDRSYFPRDVVRSNDGQQLGTVLSISATCDVLVAGTTKVLKGVNVSDFRPMTPFNVDDMVAYGPWIGRVQESNRRTTLKFNDETRVSVDSEVFEENPGRFWPALQINADEPFPGQKLSVRGKFFKDVKWISGAISNIRMGNWYSLLVEKVETVDVVIKWGARAFTGDEGSKGAVQTMDGHSKLNKESSVDIEKGEGSFVDPVSDITEDNAATPPPSRICRDDLKKLRTLNHYWQGHIWVRNKYRYRLNLFQAVKLNQNKSKADHNMQNQRWKKRFRNKAATDGDDEDSEHEDIASNITPSSGAYASYEAADYGIEVRVNTDSDLNNVSTGQANQPFLGMLVCKFGEYHLTFTLTKKRGKHEKKILHCNIQYPGHSEKIIINEMGKQFQSFIRSSLKKREYLQSSHTPVSVIMTLCPQAVRSFILQHPAIAVVNIYFECTTGSQCISGVIDKDGKKTELEFASSDHDSLGLGQVAQILDEVTDDDSVKSVLDCASTAPARQQTGHNINFLEGQWITVEIRETFTTVDVQWQDGTVQNGLKAKDLFPANHVDDHEFCPGDFVIDKREAEKGGNRNDRYGVVLKMDNKNRMVQVKWMKSGKPDVVEEVSSYEIADSEALVYRVSDIVARTGGSRHTQTQDESCSKNVGEVLRVTENGMLRVIWTDGTISLAHPLDVNNITKGDEDSFIFASTDSEEDTSWTTASSMESHSSSDSEIIGDVPHQDSSNSEENAPDHERDRGEGAAQRQDTETEINESDDESNSPSGEDTETAVSQFVNELIQSACCQLEIDDLTADESLDDSHDQVAGEPSAEEEINSSHDDTDCKSSENTLPSTSQEVNENSGAFSVESYAPKTHHFIDRHFDVTSSKKFMKAFQRDIKLLQSFLPPGITVKAYEDRMDLLSALVEGPSRTPYENGLFAFHICLSSNYPESPPYVHYISYSFRLNPNLYETGRICISLLGTWNGKGNEVWTKNSTILQVLLSIQGLILNSEPYYNEAGYEGHRGSAEGATNSRCYNEMVTLRLVQHMTTFITAPPIEFLSEMRVYCKKHIPLLVARIKDMFCQSQCMDSNDGTETSHDIGFPLLPLSKGVTLSLQDRLKQLEGLFTIETEYGLLK